ncbi:hypothetical protein ACSSZE_03445 [Acidithiobacillus caldus]
MKIALDADGVLFDFVESWRLCAQRVLGRDLPTVVSCHDLEKRFGLRKGEAHKVWSVWNTTHGWRRVIPIVPAIEITLEALYLGHEVFVVSRLPSSEAAQERRDSLDRWGLQKATLIPVYGESKKAALQELRPHFYADDCAVHCREARDTFVPVIVRIQAWGPDPIPEGVQEFCDLRSALQLFLQKSASPVQGMHFSRKENTHGSTE